MLVYPFRALLWISVCLVCHDAFRSLPRFSGFINKAQPRSPFLHDPKIRLNTKLYGIPKLFRWLVDLYPLVLGTVNDGLSSSKAMSVDNFYLDMNGIIHTCTHSNDDKLIPLNEKDMFLRIFAYTDRLYKLVNPKKLMVLAVDGVAPRAKMNQQRSRRFRSSKEREVLIAEHIAKHGKLPDEESFDSNCITPGTEFMHRLSIAFRRWIEFKMRTDPYWQHGAEIVFSGPDVPGEGEHKIMDFIRGERAKDPDYSPGKERHCLYGLDADLIMLSLVTHEPYFVLLREKTMNVRSQKSVKDVMSYTPEDFECLEVTLLRKMLHAHYQKLQQDINRLAASRPHSHTVPITPQLDTKVSKKNNIGDSLATSESTVKTASTPVAAWSGMKDDVSKRIAAMVHSSPAQWQQAFDLERIIDDFVFMYVFLCLVCHDINFMFILHQFSLPMFCGIIGASLSEMISCPASHTW